ncbi:PRC-barrel domain-containing protein [Pseudogemmobacter sonorensis]|uniref:PRC-barrel domain-containing protein n=1 Tax=Pseudogemmobacter sonorensis TaxID=2989681 RepID=UPI0036B1D0D9
MKRITPIAALASAMMLTAPAFAQDSTVVPPVDTQPGIETAPALEPETLPGATPDIAAAPVGLAPPEGYVAVTDLTMITATDLIGATLYDATGASLGSVSDIELGADDSLSGLVVDIGGFLGIGTHTVSLGTESLAVFREADGNGLVAATSLDEDTLKAMPEYVPPMN